MLDSEMAKIQVSELTYDSSDLGSFYELYSSIFNIPEESETLENIRKYLFYKTTNFYGKNNYHVIIARESKIVGFLIGDYYENSSFGIIEFIGVDKEFRGRGLSKLLLRAFEISVEEDAKNSGNKLNGFMIEVEDPQRTGDNDNSLPFWDHNGYRLVCVDYIQPPLSEGKLPAQNLLLLVKDLSGNSYIKAGIFLSLLSDYFRYAMGKEHPEEIDEFIRIKNEISLLSYVNLRKVGPALFGGVAVHYFLTVDVGTLVADLHRFQDELVSALYSRKQELSVAEYGFSIKSGRITDGEIAPFILARYLQNNINFSSSYSSRRFVVRFTFHSWEQEDVTVGFEAVPGRKYCASMSISCSYNSMGVLGIEIILRFQGLIFPELMMEMVERINLRINEHSVESIAKGKLEGILELLGKEGTEIRDYDVSRQIYPLVIATSYKGNLDTRTLYGILNGDTSYDFVSRQEVEKAVGSNLEREDLSIVDSISVYYQFNSAFVASKTEESIFNNIEEITGYTVPELILRWRDAKTSYDANKIVLHSAEAEYVTEIELLRNQFSILLGIVDKYTDKAISYRLLQEQRTLIADEEKIERRMIEINLIDVEHFTSLKSALQNAQRQMGILELKERATQLRNTLYRETSSFFDLSQARKSNILNFLVAILIISSSLVALADSLQHPYMSIYIEIISTVSALVLLVLYLIPIRTSTGGKTGRK
ncbi:MAG: GNAT family N-acetyltransferase [Thermoplasmata archaeon]